MDKKLTPREQKRIESDRRILEATIEVVGKKGYTNANLREIASVAGVTQGLVSQRFETKENLLMQAIRSTKIMWRENEFSLDMPVANMLMFIVEDIKTLHEENPLIFKFMDTIVSSVDVPDEVPSTQREYFKASIAYKIMERGQEEGYLPTGDVAVLYNIFLCNTFRLIRDYERMGLPVLESKYFLAPIQYRDPFEAEHEFLREKALDSVSKSFFSLIYFYIHSESFRISRTSHKIEAFCDPNIPIRECMEKACRELVAPEDYEAVMEFLDLSTVIERIGEKPLIVMHCTGVDQCRYRISFIFITNEDEKEIVLFGIRKVDVEG